MALKSLIGDPSGVLDPAPAQRTHSANDRARPSSGGEAGRASVAFFVLGGVGNLGNDASLEAMISGLRRHSPDARFMCICGDPEAIKMRFQMPTVPIESRITAGAVYRLFNKVTLRQLGHARNWYETWRALKGVDVMLIPGTGVLDDFGVRAFGFPYRLLMWCVAAKLRGAKLAFVSTGAGPITHPLSRFFMLSAARLADWRSYRDEVSRAFMEAHGFRDGATSVYPDLVFSLRLDEHDTHGPPCESGESGARKTISVGCMNYFGWENDRTAGRAIHERYIARLAELIAGLGKRGHRVRVLVGDEDQPTIPELGAELRSAGVDQDAPWLEICVAKTLSQHAAHIAQSDIVVGTRYHTVVAGLALARPTISLGYAKKFDAVMSDFGLQRYCDHAESFEPEHILAHIDALSADFTGVRQRLAETLSRERQRLALQEELLVGLLPRRDK